MLVIAGKWTKLAYFRPTLMQPYMFDKKKMAKTPLTKNACYEGRVAT